MRCRGSRASGNPASSRKIPAANGGIGIGVQRTAQAAIALIEDAQAKGARFLMSRLAHMNRHVPFPHAPGVYLVAGRIDRADGPLRLEVHRNRPRHGIAERLAPEQGIVHTVAVLGQNVFIAQADFLFLARLNRKDAGLNQVLPRELQQTGVAHARHNAVVDATGFVAGKQFRGELASAIPRNAETAHHGLGGHRHEQLRFDAPRAVVAKGDFQFRHGHAVLNLYIRVHGHHAHPFSLGHGANGNGRNNDVRRPDDAAFQGSPCLRPGRVPGDDEGQSHDRTEGTSCRVHRISSNSIVSRFIRPQNTTPVPTRL